MATNTDLIQQLYVAYYNRPADVAGLTFWLTAMDNGATIDQISKSFNTATEYTSNYTGKSADQIVNTVYQNLFGRAADSVGLDFWGPKIQSGAISTADLVKAIAAGALNVDGSLNADGLALANKVAAAEAFTTELSTAGNEAERVAYASATTAALAAAKAYIASVTDDTSLATAVANVHATAVAIIPVPAPVVATLTIGVDSIVGTSANDTINAILGGTVPTLTPLDSIDGAGGTNVLNIADVSAAGGDVIAAGVTIKNIQTINLASAAAAGATGAGNSFDVSGFADVKTLNVSASKGADFITAASTQAVNVVDTAGKVTVTGGLTQNVTTAGGVALSKAAGAITVVDSAQGVAVSTVDGGTTVNVKTAEALATGTPGGALTIGGTTAASGAVTVASTLAGDATGVTTGGAIGVTGGTTISVTETAVQPLLATAGTNYTLTQGAVTVTGSAATTAVTVAQTAATAAAATVLAATAVNETGSVVFTGLAAGATLITNGLTFTNGATALTAAQTAAIFANLSAGATQGNSTFGTYSGALAGWSTGAVNGTTLVFTASTNANVTDLAFTGTGLATATVTETGFTAAAVAAGRVGVVGGVVQITDAKYVAAGTNTITSATLSGYGDTSFVKSDALTSLSLSNVASTNAAALGLSVFNRTATTLALTVNNVTSGSTGKSTLNLDAGAATYTTLNIATAAKDSALQVTGSVVQTLAVSGSNAIDLSGSSFAAVKKVTVSGAAGATFAAAIGGANLTDVNAASSSGANTFFIDGTQTTYEGGSGVDTLTINSTTVSKAITLGAGNDSVTLANSTTAISGSIDGGAGTDKVTMLAADAVTFSGSAVFAGKVTGFEVLGLTGGTGAQLVHVDVLGAYNSVTTGLEAAAGVLTLDGFTSGGTLTLTGDAGAGAGYIVSGAAFTTPTTDVFNIGLSKAGILAAGSVTANSIETINIVASDTTSKVVAGTNVDTLTLVADSVTKIVVTGNAGLNLTSANTTVTSVDASGLTGGLTYTTAGTVAETVKGGAFNNFLTAHTGNTADVLIGGAGSDTLTSNAGLDILTGGAGKDLFIITTPSANVNSYATITDAAAGDSIQFSTVGAVTFSQSKVTLASTAVFQDYANAAVSATSGAVKGTIAWFQYGGDTYIVQNETGSEASFNATTTTDLIVKLTGTVDLSKASLSTDHAVLLLG